MHQLDNGDTSAAPEVETPAETTLQPDSPRTVWFKANQKKLEAKEEEEKRAKAEIQAKAKEYVKQFSEVCRPFRVPVLNSCKSPTCSELGCRHLVASAVGSLQICNIGLVW